MLKRRGAWSNRCSRKRLISEPAAWLRARTNNVAFSSWPRKDIEGATQAFRSARDVSDPSDMILLPEIEHGLARCALQRGDLSEADELCGRAIEMFRRAARHQQLAPVIVTRAQVMLGKGDAVTATKLADEAIDDASRVPTRCSKRSPVSTLPPSSSDCRRG